MTSCQKEGSPKAARRFIAAAGCLRQELEASSGEHLAAIRTRSAKPRTRTHAAHWRMALLLHVSTGWVSQSGDTCGRSACLPCDLRFLRFCRGVVRCGAVWYSVWYSRPMVTVHGQSGYSLSGYSLGCSKCWVVSADEDKSCRIDHG